MPKVTNPLFSGDARGKFGNMLIFTRGGQVRIYFKSRNPNTVAQQAVREAFKEFSMAGLTQEQANLLYAAISHLHDDRYAFKDGLHREILPWGPYANLMPLTESGYPFLVTVDRPITFIKFSIAVYVLSVNSNDDYWNVFFLTAAGDTIKTLTTQGLAASTWHLLSVDTFNLDGVTVADKNLQVRCVRVGVAGGFFAATPILEVDM